MKALRSFTVRPSLPPELAALEELAMNLRWSWDAQTRDLFRWVDPDAWDATVHDPVRLLGVGLPRAPRGPGRRPRLHALPRRGARRAPALPRRRPLVPGARRLAAAVGRLLLARVRHRRGAPPVLGRPRRARRRPPEGGQRPRRAARRHRALLPPRLLPPVAVGRRLAAGALPRPRPARHGAAPLRRRPHRGRPRRRRRSWPASGGPTSAASRCTCSTPTSTRTRPSCRSITDRLYGGDTEHRLRQEILLGIGGVRALDALGIDAQVFHTNEGHAGFLGLERIRQLVTDDGLSYPRPSRRCGPGASSPRTRRSRPASTGSRAS